MVPSWDFGHPREFSMRLYITLKPNAITGKTIAWPWESCNMLRVPKSANNPMVTPIATQWLTRECPFALVVPIAEFTSCGMLNARIHVRNGSLWCIIHKYSNQSLHSQHRPEWQTLYLPCKIIQRSGSGSFLWIFNISKDLRIRLQWWPSQLSTNRHGIF